MMMIYGEDNTWFLTSVFNINVLANQAKAKRGGTLDSDTETVERNTEARGRPGWLGDLRRPSVETDLAGAGRDGDASLLPPPLRRCRHRRGWDLLPAAAAPHAARLRRGPPRRGRRRRRQADRRLPPRPLPPARPPPHRDRPGSGTPRRLSLSFRIPISARGQLLCSYLPA
jgi:hypothetical protein